MDTRCQFCGELVDPLDRFTYRWVVGWERKAVAESRKGGSDIVLREPRDRWAHAGCVALAAAGIAPGQTSLV